MTIGRQTDEHTHKRTRNGRRLMDGDRPGSSRWNSLLSRARLALDDDAMASYVKRRSAMERKRERNLAALKEEGRSEPYDFYQVQETLVEYDACGKFRDACLLTGAGESECIEAKAWDADIKLVWDFVKMRLKDRIRARAEDIALDAQEGLGRLVKDDAGECKINPKALELALERTVPEVYGNPDRKDSGRFAGGPGISYNLPGITVNLITAPSGLIEAKPAGAVVEAEAIDVTAGLIGEK